MKNIWFAMDGGFNFKFFKVMMGDVPIGFTVLDRDTDVLFSFGINRKYRNQMVTVAWFGQIRNFLTEHFTCSLWNQNKRAIRFLERNGMTVLRKNEIITTLVLQ
jgi:RimJ/RimL family protein N-acetyltransferase